jgi:hypothetical protein
VVEQPEKTIFAEHLRLDPLLTEQTLEAHPTSASASAVASAKWKNNSPPIHKAAAAEAVSTAWTVDVPANTELLQAPGFAIAEPAGKQEIPVFDKPAAASPRERAIAAPAVEAKAPAVRKADVVPAMVVSGPLLTRLRPPIYGAPFSSLSMFPQERKPETAPRTAAVAAARSVAVTHPLAAVVLTIILSFVVSMGIFIYVSTSLVGQLLFRWEEKIGSGFYSRSLPQSLKPPGSLVPDDANTPNR